ncbi:hypothetical protein SAMN05216474_0918 [Lishizhenia tianjinensis]|uniref:VWA domain-containing protein n=1 Tax=Lishizhenia tianjinensis TaxID=477690 RepID=A0A1I6YI53_9FLAO|nr:hypothetical protein [Lishizhenia tianjinensis]SFT50195.1 hypothetical protein SAMN05216474_0918 [Lishizhenia tianjinensis]
MQKLITEIPLIWGALWIALSFLLSLWYYRRKDWLSDLSRGLVVLMMSLRFLALSLLGVLVLGIMYASEEERVEQPILITLVDDSKSMLNYKDSAIVAENIQNYQQAIAENFGGDFEILNFYGNQIAEGQPLTFNGQKSDLSTYFEGIHEKYYQRNIGGIIFYSDGNFNAGINPIYSAEKIKLTPVFTIGVGDTIEKTDQLIREVLANDIAFLNNKFQVSVNVEARKLKGKRVALSVYKGDARVAQEFVSYSTDELSSQKIDFILNADQIGYQHYRVVLAGVEEEYNLKNNSYDFYVEVMDGRNSVLLTSAAPHPDLGAIKNALADNDNLNVEAKVIEKVDKALDSYDLIVLHDPGTLKPEKLKEILSLNKPVLFILGTQSGDDVINKLPIGLSTRLGNQLDDVQGAVNKNFSNFVISDELAQTLSQFPPLQVKYGSVVASNATDIALFQSLGKVATKKPLISFNESNGVKYGTISGEGIWRWKIADYARNQSTANFNILIDKITQYLVLKKDASNLRVKLPRVNSTLEDVQVQAEFYNDNLERINTADIQFVLKKGKEENVYDFAKTAQAYHLNLGKLPAGQYAWKAQTLFNGKNYIKQGELVVNAVVKEDLDTKANHKLLHQISENSHGKFFGLKDQQALIHELNSRGDITPITYTSSTYKDLIDFITLFAIIIALLTLEWFLRRYNGAY